MNQTVSIEIREPAVSVVLLCRNERDNIEACVQSILKQEIPSGGFELIVVDGMSDDGTRKILEKISQENPTFCWVDNPQQTTPHAMNIGINRAKGQYIAIMGAHNYYALDYLRRGIEVLEETGADNVGGAMICEAESLLQEAIATAHHSPFSVGGARWHNPDYEGPADTVFGGIYRREVFDNIGFFDEELIRNQDDEFNLRLKKAGGVIWQSPKIKSWYKPRRTLGGLFGQYMQYGYWKIRVMQKHKMPASIRHVIPGGFVLLLLTLPLFSIFWVPARWVFLGLLLAYSACNLVASCVASLPKKWKVFLILPIVFLCYHVGYGYGSLRGIWDFVIWRILPSRAFSKVTRSQMR